MKKLILLLIVALFTLTLASCSLNGISIEEAEANLKEAGYTDIVIMTGEEYVNQEDCEYPSIFASELDYYLYARKGQDYIKMFYFWSVDAASSNAEWMFSPDYTGQTNNIYYIGTRQAIKDVKI